jgi:hypothetical protein
MSYTIDKETGEFTTLGALGFDANFAQGGNWDPVNDNIYLCAYGSVSDLRILDKETGGTTTVGSIASETGAFGIPGGGNPGGGGGDVPPGLMSFNIYRDGVYVGMAPYSGEGVDDSIPFIDNGVDPGCHDYTATAVYNLAPYGFPGQTAESMEEGPDNVCVVWGYDLPFMEDWASGNFDFNGWSTQSGVNNWVVSGQNGDPAPSAQFNWDPDPNGEYSITLESPPLKADMMTEGDIWLDFEYYLENRNATGMENLTVEVYNGQDWMQVATYSNGQSMGWTFQHLQITNNAMGRVFRVRFNANGMNSFDVIRWNVDNIHVYRQCEAPTDLAGTYDGDGQNNDGLDFGAYLTWEAPYIPPPPQGWIRWDDGTLFSGIGLTDGGDYMVAARWDAGQLTDWNGIDFTGASITKITMAANDGGFDHMNMMIWKGANAGTLLWESGSVMPTVGDWTEYTVDPAVPVDVNDELWIGYEVIGQPAGMFPAGTDAGPAEAGYGDKISTDGVTWDNLSDFGLDYNWSLAAYLEIVDGSSAVITPLADNREYHNTNNALSKGESRDQGVVMTDDGSRSFTSFNIYRKGPEEMDYTLIDNVPYVEGQTSYDYYDEDPFPGQYPYMVCYQVTGVWESSTDYCESSPAIEANIPFNDYVCVNITSIDNPLSGDVTVLYPNPAKDRVNIMSSRKMDRITVINYVGQVVYDKEMNGSQTYELNTSSYDAGVYIVKINTNNGVVTKRMTISQ